MSLYNHRCPRCGCPDRYETQKCRGCGLEGYTYNSHPLPFDPRLLEKFDHDIRVLQDKVFREVITSVKTNKMTTIGNMMKRLLDADTQTLVKAGYINGDLELTEAGKKALWAITFTLNKDALVKEAQEVLDAVKSK